MISRTTLKEFYKNALPPEQNVPEGYVYWWEKIPFAHVHLLGGHYAFFWLGKATVGQAIEAIWPVAKSASNFINQHTSSFKEAQNWSLEATCALENDGKGDFLEVIRPTTLSNLDLQNLSRAFPESPIAIHLTLEFGRYFVRGWANVDSSKVKYPEVGIAANVPLMDSAIQLFTNTCEIKHLREDKEIQTEWRAEVDDLMHKAL